MALPGKLCVGILEEDNPLRSYFRFKPLLVEENGRYVPFEDSGIYPDEGCIRIVPDKNESYYFKSRMRQNGLFSVVDLRDHPNENDKIRPNKNYRHGGGEINACIIYSDVVRRPAPDMLYQLLPADTDPAGTARPKTPMVLLRQPDGVSPICYAWEEVDRESGKVCLRQTEKTCAIADFQVFEVPDFHGETLSFLIKPAALMTTVCDPSDRITPRQELAGGTPERIHREEAAPAEREKHFREEKTVSEKKPVSEEVPAHPPVAAAPQPEVRPAEVKPAEVRPAEPVPAEPKPAEPNPVEAAPAEPAPENAEKPWIHHDARMLPPPIDRRLSRAQQIMAAQAGLNPRRGRSLQELIDEKWQYSRINHLGTPVSPITTGQPVPNPVDTAVDAVRNAWSYPNMRAELLDALTHVGSFSEQLKENREIARQSDIAQQLNALEAQRLELLADLERIRAGSHQVREQLKQEIRREESDALADAVEKTRAAQAEQQKYEQLASDARLAAQDAQGALDALVGDQLENKIRDVALTRRVEERLNLLKGAGEGDRVPAAPEKIGFNAFVDRLMKRLDAAGWGWSREDAANLCVSFALSPVLFISGAPGSGKTTLARMLADSLGLSGAGRCLVLPPDRKPLREDPRVESLARFEEMPALLCLDDANLAPTRDALRGMAQSHNPEWRMTVTLQDLHSGHPLSANALDQGFMVRLTPSDDLPWQPPIREALPPDAPISLSYLRTSLPRAEVPQEVVRRMEQLRKAMASCGASLSRRALDDAWRYCSTMMALANQRVDADKLFDRAVTQRLLPVTLASAPIEAVLKLRELTADLPMCAAWLKQPLPVDVG